MVLPGGNMNAVVRIGSRVHRAAAPHSPTVHRLLTHVRAQGITWIPQVHGFDDAGREVLDYLPGDVHHVLEPFMTTDTNLRTVGARLREWHDAAATFEHRDDDVWWQAPLAPVETVCHVDFAPYNHVYRGHAWAGAIDFDLCTPGPRLWDLAYTAYRYVPLTPHRDDAVADGEGPDRTDAPAPERARRLAVLLEGYGSLVIDDAARAYRPHEVLAWVPRRLDAMADWCATQESPDLQRNGVMYRAHARWLERPDVLDTLNS